MKDILVNIDEKTLDGIQSALDFARQGDLENGVKWLNEAAAEEFARKYPNINQVINNILEMDDGAL